MCIPLDVNELNLRKHQEQQEQSERDYNNMLDELEKVVSPQIGNIRKQFEQIVEKYGFDEYKFKDWLLEEV